MRLLRLILLGFRKGAAFLMALAFFFVIPVSVGSLISAAVLAIAVRAHWKTFTESDWSLLVFGFSWFLCFLLCFLLLHHLDKRRWHVSDKILKLGGWPAVRGDQEHSNK